MVPSLPKTMKQWVTDYTGVENLKQETVELPQPGEGEVLVKVHTVSINFRDVEVCIGDYDHHESIPPPKTVVPCSDMVATIVKFGPPSPESPKESWAEGDRVMAIFNLTHQTGQITDEHLPSGVGLPLPGVLCEYQTFPLYGLVKVPDKLNNEEGSTLPIAVATAWMALNWMQPIGQPLKGPEIIVLLQGTGGVSIAGLQLAKALGMTTIITSSSDAKLSRAKSLGADHTINYATNPSWHTEVLRLTSNRGASIIFEQGGPATLSRSFACVAWGGTISCIGYLSGKRDAEDERINTNVLALRRNVTLKGIWGGAKDRLVEALAWYESDGGIKPVVDRVFGFEEAREALGYVQRGSHFGKVVVRVS